MLDIKVDIGKKTFGIILGKKSNDSAFQDKLLCVYQYFYQNKQLEFVKIIFAI